LEIKYTIVISGKTDLHYFEKFDSSAVEIIQIKTHPNLTVWKSRKIGFLKSRGPIVFFFDQDVKRPDSQTIDLLASLFSKSAYQCWGGQYINPPNPKPSLKSYNRLCDLWSESRSVFLGGLFALKKTEGLITHFKNLSDDHAWGGEDLSLSQSLKENNISIEFPTFFSAEHNADTSLLNTIRRAWIHGCRKWELRKLKTRWQWPQIYLNDISHLPFFGLHFFIMFIAFILSAMTLKTILWQKALTAPKKYAR
jgi:hypothetical protein